MRFILLCLVLFAVVFITIWNIRKWSLKVVGNILLGLLTGVLSAGVVAAVIYFLFSLG